LYADTNHAPPLFAGFSSNGAANVSARGHRDRRGGLRQRPHLAPQRVLRATTPHWRRWAWRYAVRRSQSGRIMPNRFAPGAQRAGWEAGVARANRIAAEVAPIIAELRAAGITSKKGIANALNRRAVRTPRGIGEWRPIQVARVLARLPV
jgi:hypothetical protein